MHTRQLFGSFQCRDATGVASDGANRRIMAHLRSMHMQVEAVRQNARVLVQIVVIQLRL